MEKQTERILNDMNRKSFGGNSVIYINDTGLHEFKTSAVYCIQVITACVFDTGTSFFVENYEGILSDGLPAGTYFIKSEAIKLASGSLIAYRA
jgi:hypothetical protein